MHIDKKPLDFADYDQYEIPHEITAFKITLLNVSQEQVDQYEQDLLFKGEQLVHANMSRSNDNLFNVELIVSVSKIVSSFKN